MPEGFISDFKRFFVRGLAVLLPTLVTLWLMVIVFRFIQDYLGQYMDFAAQWTVVQFHCLLDRSSDNSGAHWESVRSYWKTYRLSWVGFVLALVVIYVVGRFITSFVGRSVWHVTERAFFRTPVVRQVYPFVKQVTDFLFAQRRMRFSDVVAVEYPRKGIWSVGLLTGDSIKSLRDMVGEDLVTVFVPSSPTPFTGYTITVRRREVVELPLSIDEALRFTVSGGVIMPASQITDAAKEDTAEQGAAEED